MTDSGRDFRKKFKKDNLKFKSLNSVNYSQAAKEKILNTLDDEEDDPGTYFEQLSVKVQPGSLDEFIVKKKEPEIKKKETPITGPNTPRKPFHLNLADIIRAKTSGCRKCVSSVDKIKNYEQISESGDEEEDEGMSSHQEETITEEEDQPVDHTDLSDEKKKRMIQRFKSVEQYFSSGYDRKDEGQITDEIISKATKLLQHDNLPETLRMRILAVLNLINGPMNCIIDKDCEFISDDMIGIGNRIRKTITDKELEIFMDVKS